MMVFVFFFFFQAEDGIRDLTVTGVQTCALPISLRISRGAPCAPSAACACSADCRQPCPPFSGGNLHGCVKIDLSRCPARHHSSPAWARRTNTVSPHSAEMKLNRHLDALEG